MKIEKISEIQLKIILDESDLAEHGIKLSELIGGTDKIYALFHEMMEQALEEYGFEVKNTPLLVEAIPMALNSIIIIITKVQHPELMNEEFTFSPSSRTSGRFKTRDLLEVEAPREKTSDNNRTLMYSFDSLDNLMDAASRLFKVFEGDSAVYKYHKQYFLLLKVGDASEISFEHIEAIMTEYGQRYTSGTLSGYYLQDHGEVIIKQDAIKKLAQI